MKEDYKQKKTNLNFIFFFLDNFPIKNNLRSSKLEHTFDKEQF